MIAWKRILGAAFVYISLSILFGTLLIDMMHEQVGPLTDLLISVLLVICLVSIVARRVEYSQTINGLLTGFACGLAQFVLALLAGQISLFSVISTIVAFTLAGFVGGFAFRIPNDDSLVNT